ncbi:MAG: PmoA family protein [Armatimonadetes bacterium]|nr:PmoA family protein [Armatimonadota bacterium]
MPLSAHVEDPGRITLTSLTGPIFTYHYGAEVGKPYLHPLYTPSGSVLTSVAPEYAPGHRGVFFGWADVNGVDFWHEGQAPSPVPQGRITTEGDRVQLETEKDRIRVYALHLWKRPDGYVLLEEHRVLTAHEPEEEGWQVLDWRSEFHAPFEDVVLGNVQKSMGLSYSASEELAGGHFINSRQLEGPATNGRAAEWCDFAGPEKNGPHSGGVAIMASRRNPHPRPEFFTAAEPLGFISASFAYRAPFTVRKGESVTLLYRLVLHDGPGDPMFLQTYYTAFLWG